MDDGYLNNITNWKKKTHWEEDGEKKEKVATIHKKT
jgi:hypothetical protein